MHDRQRWNRKYEQGEHLADTPSQLIEQLAPRLPAGGRALDLAGGAGRHAIWLARQGYRVTLADISDVALSIAARRAAAEKLAISFVQTDLESEPPPAGPWQLVLAFHFLWRPLFADLPALLAPAGRLVVVHPTRRNLERHARPPARFLLEEGELPELVRGLEVIQYEEDWLCEGRHEALLVARRKPFSEGVNHGAS